jgi:hypothetical protein
MGIVQAWDLSKGTLLWEKQLYKIKYDQNLELDVQDVYIKSMSIENGKLVVRNEKEAIFSLDLQSELNQAEQVSGNTEFALALY